MSSASPTADVHESISGTALRSRAHAGAARRVGRGGAEHRLPGLRVTGEMTWALAGAAGSERLMEYEAKGNRYFPTADIVAICQYNRRFFPAELIKQVIETHPLVIHGATVCRNPYYVPPIMRDISGRGAAEER